MTTVDTSRGMVLSAPESDGFSARAPGDPLDLVLDHLRGLVRADAALVIDVDPDRTQIAPVATWFSSPQLRDAILPALTRRYDRDRPALTEAAIERGGPLLLPRIEDWEASAHPRDYVVTASSGESWELLRRGSVIAAPIRTPLGRTLGALIVLSVDSRRPLGKSDLDVVTVLADLAALARERSELLADEAARAREELLLKRAAEGTSATLEPHEVERQVVVHAVQIAAADHGRLSRVQPGSQRLVTVAEAGAKRALEPATVGEIVRTRTPLTLDGKAPSVHVPIELGPRLFGVLSLVRDDGREFDREDLTLPTNRAGWWAGGGGAGEGVGRGGVRGGGPPLGGVGAGAPPRQVTEPGHRRRSRSPAPNHRKDKLAP